MNYNNNNKRKQMEDEMSRFEKEISGQANYHQQPQQQFKPAAMFIPHQLQRQQRPPQNLMPPQMIPHNLQHNPTPQQFLPGHQPNPHLIIPPPSQPINHGFKPMMQSQQQFIPHSNQMQQQSLQQHQTNNQPTSSQQPIKPPSSYTVTPMALPTNVHNVSNPVQPSNATNKKQKTSDSNKNSKKQKKLLRQAGGQVWEDTTLQEWDNEDYRIFCGDLGNDVNEDILTRAFSKYPSFIKCKVVRDKRTNKSKGYGFISFKEPNDFIKAMRDMDGKYVGSRPIKLRRSTWKDRNLDVVKKKQKMKEKLGLI